MLTSTIFTLFLICVAITDFRERMIYDKVLFVSAAIFFPLNFFEEFVNFPDAIFNAGLGFATMFAIYKFSGEGMGGGDVKFVSTLGLWLGGGLFPAIFTAAIFAAVFTLPLVLKSGDVKIKIPFGVFLSIGAFLQFVFGINFFEVLP